MSTEYSGSCLCGACEVTAKGPAFSAFFCHCSICRRYLGAPYNASAVFGKGSITFKKGQDHLTSYKTSEAAVRMRCSTCGAPMCVNVDAYGIQMLPLSVLSSVPAELKPKAHVYYADRVFDVKDGLPKFKASSQGPSAEPIPE